MTDSGRDLLDVEEAAEFLGGVSTKTVQRLVVRGRLGRVKIGRLTRYRRSELLRYIQDNERRVA